MAFVHFHAPHATPGDNDLCLVMQGDRILAMRETEGTGGLRLPEFGELVRWPDVSDLPLHVGLLDDRPLWLFAVEQPELAAPAGREWQEIRAMLGQYRADQMQAISCARQLQWWDRRHRFCGICGTPTEGVIEERARRCPKCHAVYFPSVFPAVIVAVTRGAEILLAHNRNFRPGMFSVLAGFMDPGETLEQTVKREVREEVGIEIEAVTYVASQPWSFPNSLMIGFRARYVSGEMKPDGKEIEEAGWFKPDKLPEIPRVGTIARQLIEDWRK